MANIATGISQFSIAGRVVPIYPTGFQSALMLLNTGNNPAYVGDSPSFNSSSGIPLNPGATLNWDTGRPLFLLADAVNTTTVIVALNSGPLNDPNAIAIALIDQGLAVEIGDQIALKGAPPINSFDQLANLAQSAYPFTSGSIDASKYQSLDIIAFETMLTGVLNTPIPRAISLLWDNGLIDTFYLTDARGSVAVFDFAHFQVPVRAATFTISIGSNARATASTTQVLVSGSYRTQNGTAFRQISAYWGVSGVGSIGGDGTDNYASWNFAKSTSIINEYPPTVAGDCSLWVATNAVAGTGNLSILVLDVATQVQMAQVTVNNGAIGNSGTYFKAPNRPIQLQITPAAATCSAVHVTIVSDGG